MKKYAKRKPLIKYRFKDRLGCVWFNEFATEREARLWYERNKIAYYIVEFNSIGYNFPVI